MSSDRYTITPSIIYYKNIIDPTQFPLTVNVDYTSLSISNGNTYTIKSSSGSTIQSITIPNNEVGPSMTNTGFNANGIATFCRDLSGFYYFAVVSFNSYFLYKYPSTGGNSIGGCTVAASGVTSQWVTNFALNPNTPNIIYFACNGGCYFLNVNTSFPANGGSGYNSTIVGSFGIGGKYNNGLCYYNNKMYASSNYPSPGALYSYDFSNAQVTTLNTNFSQQFFAVTDKYIFSPNTTNQILYYDLSGTYIGATNFSTTYNLTYGICYSPVSDLLYVSLYNGGNQTMSFGSLTNSLTNMTFTNIYSTGSVSAPHPRYISHIYNPLLNAVHVLLANGLPYTYYIPAKKLNYSFNASNLKITDSFLQIYNGATPFGLAIPLLLLCFLQGTKILRMNQETDDEEYVPIETLRRGDLIKTANHGYKAIELIGSTKLDSPSALPIKSNRLRWFRKSKISGLKEDLCVTGDHCILYKSITPEKKEQVVDHMGDLYITENYYRVPAFLDDRSEPYEESGPATIWHFALEHTDVNANYGVMANGLLVESSCLRHMYHNSNMKLIE